MYVCMPYRLVAGWEGFAVNCHVPSNSPAGGNDKCFGVHTCMQN